VRLSLTTHYALLATLELARESSRAVSVAEVAARNRIPETALAKVFQQLVRARLARGTRGVGGGYRLARPASHVTVLDVVRAFEPPEPPRLPVVARGGWAGARLRALFDEVDELAESTFESVSLETLADGPRLKAKAG
jgi:Rrf2 family protein